MPPGGDSRGHEFRAGLYLPLPVEQFARQRPSLVAVLELVSPDWQLALTAAVNAVPALFFEKQTSMSST